MLDLCQQESKCSGRVIPLCGPLICSLSPGFGAHFAPLHLKLPHHKVLAVFSQTGARLLSHALLCLPLPLSLHFSFSLFLSITLIFLSLFFSVLLFWPSASPDLSCVSLILVSTVASHYYTLDEVHICGMSLTAFTSSSLSSSLPQLSALSLS